MEEKRRISNSEEALRQAAAFRQAGRFADAEAICRAVLGREPDNLDALLLIGVIVGSQNRLEEALQWTDRAISIAPDVPDLHNNRGVTLLRRGRLDEALAAFHRAIELRADFIDAYLNMARVFRKEKRTEEEVSTYEQAIRAKPDLPLLHRLLGRALSELGQRAEAAGAYRRAVELNPGYAEAHAGLGAALGAMGELDESLAHLREAIRLNPNVADAHGNLGATLQRQSHFDQAIAEYEQAIRIDPNHAKAHFNRGLILLLRGDFKAGWQEYEWRWEAEGLARRNFPFPRWNGLDLAGRSILFCGEQGSGDTIQFIRYANLLGQRGAKVIVECSEQLMPVIATVPGVTGVVPEEEISGEVDFYIPLASLPGIFATDLSNIPTQIPYVFANERRTQIWRDRLGTTEKLRVGLVWAGSPQHSNDHHRSMALADFAPLARVVGVELHSVQKGEASAQLAALAPELTLVDHSNDLRDFGDTAALLANLDLLISVDTSVLHLAGAMGRPAWALLPYSPDWRWMLDRRDSPWYPTMKLFRQPALRDWASVMQSVAQELAIAAQRKYFR